MAERRRAEDGRNEYGWRKGASQGGKCLQLLANVIFITYSICGPRVASKARHTAMLSYVRFADDDIVVGFHMQSWMPISFERELTERMKKVQPGTASREKEKTRPSGVTVP